MAAFVVTRNPLVAPRLQSLPSAPCVPHALMPLAGSPEGSRKTPGKPPYNQRRVAKVGRVSPLPGRAAHATCTAHQEEGDHHGHRRKPPSIRCGKRRRRAGHRRRIVAGCRSPTERRRRRDPRSRRNADRGRTRHQPAGPQLHHQLHRGLLEVGPVQRVADGRAHVPPPHGQVGRLPAGLPCRQPRRVHQLLSAHGQGRRRDDLDRGRGQHVGDDRLTL